MYSFAYNRPMQMLIYNNQIAVPLILQPTECQKFKQKVPPQDLLHEYKFPDLIL